MKYIMIRGPSCCGKTTTAIALAKELKKQGFSPAIIHEDNYRKSLQFKYKAADKEPHLNSVSIIKNVITTLTQNDEYDIIILEGLFRYKEMVENYVKTYNPTTYSLNQDLKTREEWNDKRTHSRENLDQYELEEVRIFIKLTNGVQQIIDDIIT